MNNKLLAEKIIRNYQKQYGHTLSWENYFLKNTYPITLSGCFVWHITPEGSSFWQTYDNILGNDVRKFIKKYYSDTTNFIDLSIYL